jgi:hypothetical protein
MNTTAPYGNRESQSHNWINLFEIKNLTVKKISYRLYSIDNLPRDENFSKNSSLLIKSVSIDLRQPAALILRDDAPFLALPSNVTLTKSEYQLTPHAVTLSPCKDISQIDFENLQHYDVSIVESFLRYAFQKPLMDHKELWGHSSRYYEKRAINSNVHSDQIDIYPGFAWNLSYIEGKFYISLDCTQKYIERDWLVDKFGQNGEKNYRYRLALYLNGNNWYMVQLWGFPQKAIAEQRFIPSGEGNPIDVYSYIQMKWKHNPPNWIANLNPNSPVVLYSYPGRKEQFYGALALCKLSLSTQDEAVQRIHHKSILSPEDRLNQTRMYVEKFFRGTQIGESSVTVLSSHLEIERKCFSVPSLRFGNDHILKIGQGNTTDTVTSVPFKDLGSYRLRLLSDPNAGPLDRSPFNAQYLLLPQSSQREVNEDFEKRFIKAMQKISHQESYPIRRILYDDRGKSTLYQQVQSIKYAISSNQIQAGYVLLVLPRNAHTNLHNYIKRELWPHLQFQCAMARKIEDLYSQSNREDSSNERKYTSYVQNCALGMMMVNRKWLWSLESPLCYDMYIGIDVLNGIAGFTFIYEQGKKIIFRDYPSKQKEKLTARQMRSIIVNCLKEILAELPIAPRHIIVHRDGRSFESEKGGFRQAVNELISQNLLPSDLETGIVDVRKSTAHNVRIFAEPRSEMIVNPPIGFYKEFSERDGVLCTTGYPFRFPGTAKPLYVTISDGNLILKNVLDDMFALSQLVFTAPDKCMRLPATIKIADDFLEPIAASVSQEEGLYDDIVDGGEADSDENDDI